MLQVRPYKTTDKKEVLRLLAELQDHVAQIDPFHRLRRKTRFNVSRYFRYLETDLKRQGKIFLATHQGKIVGVVAAAVTQDPRSSTEVKPGLSKTGRVFELMVDQNARGLGAGKKLLQAAEKFLKSKKCSIIFIGCFATNTVALDFYKRNGYMERTIEFAKKVSV